MLYRWKSILTNWNNCYFNDTKAEECITKNTLLTIISHLLKNLNSDESKTSDLEAVTVEKFILEKYPEFKFENGTTEPTSDEEIYLAASLLLYFVCVNSKDVDIKQAMCSKLSIEDQETIMKFTKAVMECSPITCKDVQIAITEACSQELAAEKGSGVIMVGETPPALRSLHGEVRRLQAALDAERFDRNYLQEELSRTNIKMEKLLKEKELCKLEIMNLKVKISLCCGQEAEVQGSETADENLGTLTRQLQEFEERLIATQEQLDDMQCERESYKAKIQDLKKERDKWLNMTQQESTRAGQLVEELEIERRRVQSLQELVAELRQHQQNNCLDGSQLECDDPNASIHTPHNASVCSEACANIIEVQLMEEKAKVAYLQDQIQKLQDQLIEITQKAETDKIELENIISDKDNDISNLKHRINEEIEEKNSLKELYNDEISKLNNNINELEQKLKENSENSRTTIENKIQEIQTLQEEKLSLLQSLSDETTKLEGIIKQLQADNETEKTLSIKIKNDYENLLMKMNEKLLNRNNELVELQNKIVENSEMIEKLNLELRTEKENSIELSNNYNNEITRLCEDKLALEKSLQIKTEESKQQQKRLSYNVSVFDELNKEIDDLKAANDDLLHHYKILEQNRNALEDEIMKRDIDVEGIRKEIENITNIFSEEKNKFVRNVEDKNATISSLQMRLHDEIQFKNGLEKELNNLQQAKNTLAEEVEKLNKELRSIKTDISDKDRTIYALDLYLKEERHTVKTIKAENEKLNEEIVNHKSTINLLEEQLESDSIRFEEEVSKRDEVIDSLNDKLIMEEQEKEALQSMVMAMNEEKEALHKDFMDRCCDLEKLQEDYDNLCKSAERNTSVIEALENKIEFETKKYIQLELDFDKQTSQLISKLNETEKSAKEISSKSKIMIEDKKLQIESLKLEIQDLSKTMEDERETLETILREKEALEQKLEEELLFKSNIEKEYQNQCAMLDSITSQLTSEITLKSSEIKTLKDEVDLLLSKNNETTEELNVMEAKLLEQNEVSREMEYLKQQEIKKLKTKIEEFKAKNDEIEQELKKEITCKIQAIDALQRENEQLHFTIEEDNSNHEVLLKEKDSMIEGLEEYLKCVKVQLESIQKDYEDGTFIWEKTKIEMQEKLESKDLDINQLKKQIDSLKHLLDQNVSNAEKVQEDLKRQVECIIKESSEKESHMGRQVGEYSIEVSQYQIKVNDLEKTIETINVDLKNAKYAISLLEKEKDELLERNRKLIEELQHEQTMNRALQTEKNLYMEESTSLAKELSELHSAQTMLQEKTGDLAAEKEVLQQQLLEMESKERELLKEKKYLLERLHSIESKNQEIFKDNLTLEQQFTEKIEKITLEMNTLKEENLILLAEKHQLQEDKNTKNTFHQKLQTLQVKYDALELANESLIKERDSYCEQCEKMKLDIITFQQKLEHEAIEKNIIADKLQALDQEMVLLIEDKKVLDKKIMDMIENEKSVNVEKEQLLQNLSELKSHKEALLADKQTAEQLLFEETAAKAAVLEEKYIISQQLESMRETFENEMRILEREKQVVDEQLIIETNQKCLLAEEKCKLEAVKNSLEHDNQKLLIDKVNLEEKLIDTQAAISLITTEKEALVGQIQSIKEITEQEKKAIARELSEEVKIKNTLLEERVGLLKNLIEEKTINKSLEDENKILEGAQQKLEQQMSEKIEMINYLEEERHGLIKQKNELIGEKKRLDQEISNLMVSKDSLEDDIMRLSVDIDEEKSTKNELYIEKQNLFTENCSLKLKVVELNAIQEILVHDKEVLNIEKEDLIKTLNVEKASRDELESEKKAVSVTLQELNEKYASDLCEKQDLLTELKQVKTDVKKHEDISVYIASVLNSGLDNLLQNIKKQNVENEFLQKLVTLEKDVEIPLSEKCDLIIKIADTLSTELSLKHHLKKALEYESVTVKELKTAVKEKEMQVLELQSEVKRLQQTVCDHEAELSKQMETYNKTFDSKVKDIQTLQLENKSLSNELNNVKVQLEVKVHSLKEKLIDNENLTDKLKKIYECQIENLNVMVSKLTSYLKEKTSALDSIRREKEKLQKDIEENNKVIKSLEEEVKTQKLNQEKLISDFESERLVLKNMISVTESVMEDQKISLNKVIADHENTIEALQEEKKDLEAKLESLKKTSDELLHEKQTAFDTAFNELAEIRKDKDTILMELKSAKENFNKEIAVLKEKLKSKVSSLELSEVQNKVLKKDKDQYKHQIENEKLEYQKEIDCLNETVKEKIVAIDALEKRNKELTACIDKLKNELLCLQERDTEHRIKRESLESELLDRLEKLTKVLSNDTSRNDRFKYNLQEKLQVKKTIQEKVKALTEEIIDLVQEKNEYKSKLDEVKAESESNQLRIQERILELTEENDRLHMAVNDNKTVIANLEQLIKNEIEENQKIRNASASERLNIENRCAILHEYQIKAEKQLQEREKEIKALKDQETYEKSLQQQIENLKEELALKDAMVTNIAHDKDEVINTLNKGLMEEKAAKDSLHKQLESKASTLSELNKQLEAYKSEVAAFEALKKENEDIVESLGKNENFTSLSLEKALGHKRSCQTNKDQRDRHQVSTSTSDLTHSSMESFKTISDLEKIIHDKNLTITTLQSDITYLKSLMADSENKLLDVTKELEAANENCEQLSSQLKKIVQQKNEEIAELKNKVSKMSVTENRATQIIKVSAKYQAIILKRIAEIKSNTILKELTNFGNNANGDSELKRNLHSGAITMEDLENFLETTDRHLKRCTEKQVALQKERDRLTEVNRINESEIISLRKFLTEVSVGFKTFSSLKDLYTQKLSRVVSVQRTVRREILALQGQVAESAMCKLERGYAAVMQDLCECTMTLERWVERCVARTISTEKLKQAYTNDNERTSLAPSTFQNASLEVQLDELEKSFQKLLEEVMRAPRGEGNPDPQAATVMEVRAEYEDKLNRMKAKMKQLYQEQMEVFKSKQKEEMVGLERELVAARAKLAESSRAYEDHIRALTTELWNVGEKFLMKKDEAEWLRKKQKSGSLMSLQHIHSGGLTTHQEETSLRKSDTQSLRSLPMHSRTTEKREGRGLQMSDEDGEVFDNRWLKELESPKREGNPAQRLSELRWRNSLCPPHLKSSYPAETQFTQTTNEEDIKCARGGGVGSGRATIGGLPRKEVGITAYKKPGPPTPSKQAGRLSATDCELRESLRCDLEPVASSSRKTSTPSRIRALFRYNKSEMFEVTSPRKRLSNIFRKK